LEQAADGIRLRQNPVKERQALRGELTQLRNESFAKGNTSLSRGDWSETLELAAALTMQGAQDVGFELRGGPSHGTRAGCDARKGGVYINRTHSGDTSIHPEFPARHEAPLKIEEGKVQIHILVDRCTCEVFADGGRGDLLI
jgi:fructan beta-fructosidase